MKNKKNWNLQSIWGRKKKSNMEVRWILLILNVWNKPSKTKMNEKTHKNDLGKKEVRTTKVALMTMIWRNIGMAKDRQTFLS